MNPLLDQQYLYESYRLSDDYDVKIHKNGIVIVFLSQNCKYQSIKFDEKVKQQLSTIEGKKKHGAVTQIESSVFAEIQIDGASKLIQSPLRAKLLEINEKQEQKVENGQILAIYQPVWEKTQSLKRILKNGAENDEDRDFLKGFVLIE